MSVIPRTRHVTAGVTAGGATVGASAGLLGAVLNLAAGNFLIAVGMLVLGAANVAVLVAARRKPPAPSPVRRPDWPHIYGMETDIYGETFHHDGAPEAVNLPPLTPLGDRLTDCQPDLAAAMAALGETVRKASRSIGPLVGSCPKGHPSSEIYLSLHQGALCGACEYERQRGPRTHCARCGVLGILARGLCATCYAQVRRS